MHDNAPPSRPDGHAPTSPLDTDRLTWAVLLGHFVDVSRAAIGLPDDAEGNRLRDSVPHLITLQAVRFALEQLERLPAEQRALGIARAGLLIDQSSQGLAKRWGDEPLPDAIQEMIDDAKDQWDAASQIER